MLEAVRVFRQTDERVSTELHDRYQMDPTIWKASQRKKFPYNLSLFQIFSLCAIILAIVCVFAGSKGLFLKSIIADRSF